TVGSLRERENVTATVGSRIGGVGGELRYGVSGRIPRQQHQSCLSVRRQSATIDRFLSTRVGLLCEQTGREQPAHVWEKLSGPAAGYTGGQSGPFRDRSRQLQQGLRDCGSQGAGDHSD